MKAYFTWDHCEPSNLIILYSSINYEDWVKLLHNGRFYWYIWRKGSHFLTYRYSLCKSINDILKPTKYQIQTGVQVWWVCIQWRDLQTASLSRCPSVNSYLRQYLPLSLISTSLSRNVSSNVDNIHCPPDNCWCAGPRPEWR